jgi:hypothetical protein
MLQEPKDQVMMKPLKFDESVFWTVIHGQSEAMAEHDIWTAQEKAMNLLTIFQVQAANVLVSVPARVTNEDIVRALKDGHYRNCQQAAVCHS